MSFKSSLLEKKKLPKKHNLQDHRFTKPKTNLFIFILKEIKEDNFLVNLINNYNFFKKDTKKFDVKLS